MEAESLMALEERLRSVLRKCEAQQDALERQKSRLRVQQLKLIRAVIKLVPDETRNDSGVVSFRRR